MIVSSGLVSHHPSTVFHRAPGFSLWTAGILLRGSAAYSIGGREERMSAPSFQLIAPGTSYTLSPGARTGPWVEAWAAFEPRAAWARMLRLPEVLPGLHSVPPGDSRAGRRVLRAAVEGIRLAVQVPQWRKEISESTLEQLLIGTQLLLEQSHAGAGRGVDERVRVVEAAVRLDLGRTWSVSQMAELVHLSPSRFAHLFANELGEAPRAFLETVRMERALELLFSTNDAVQLISHAVGFRDALHFSARFRSRFGMSPSQYRLHPSIPEPGGDGTAPDAERRGQSQT